MRKIEGLLLVSTAALAAVFVDASFRARALGCDANKVMLNGTCIHRIEEYKPPKTQDRIQFESGSELELTTEPKVYDGTVEMRCYNPTITLERDKDNNVILLTCKEKPDGSGEVPKDGRPSGQ